MNPKIIPAGLLVVATALAGCLTTSTPNEALDPATGLPVDAQASPGLLNFRGCAEHFGVFGLPEDDAGPLPEGFEPVPMGPGMVTLLSIAFECGSTTGLVEEAEGVKEFAGYISVTPPAKYQQDGVVAYLVPIGAFTSSEAMKALYDSWGFPSVSVGRIDMSTVLDASAARVGTVEGSDDANTVAMHTVAHGAPATAEAGMVRVFGHEDGMVVSVVDLSWTASNTLEGPAGLNGEAILTFSDGAMPIPIPAVGFGTHFWGDEYDYEAQPVPLAMFEEPMEEEEEEEEEEAPAKAFLPPTSIRGIPLL